MDLKVQYGVDKSIEVLKFAKERGIDIIRGKERTCHSWTHLLELFSSSLPCTSLMNP